MRLFAAAAEQLHSEANAQHRLSTGFNQLNQLTFAQLIHGGLCGPHAG